MSLLLLPGVSAGRPWWNKNQGWTANADMAQAGHTGRAGISDAWTRDASGYYFVQPAVGWEFGPIQNSQDPSRVQARGYYNQHITPPVVDLRALITQTGPGRVRQDNAAQRPADLGLKTPYYY